MFSWERIGLLVSFLLESNHFGWFINGGEKWPNEARRACNPFIYGIISSGSLPFYSKEFASAIIDISFLSVFLFWTPRSRRFCSSAQLMQKLNITSSIPSSGIWHFGMLTKKKKGSRQTGRNKEQVQPRNHGNISTGIDEKLDSFSTDHCRPPLKSTPDLSRQATECVWTHQSCYCFYKWNYSRIAIYIYIYISEHTIYSTVCVVYSGSWNCLPENN